MDPKTYPVSEDWVPMGYSLRNPARRNATDRGKRSVVESAAVGVAKVVQRDGFYRPKDDSAEHLTFWTASSQGWAPVSSFSWNTETTAWESANRTGPKPN